MPGLNKRNGHLSIRQRGRKFHKRQTSIKYLFDWCQRWII